MKLLVDHPLSVCHAEGEPSVALDADLCPRTPAGGRRGARRLGSNASLDSLDSASSYGSGLSAASSRVRDYRDLARGVPIYPC